MKNIEKYLNGAIQTDNGIVYKDEKAFKSNSGICYISEGGLEDLQNVLDNGRDLTDEEIVRKGIGATYDTILQEVKDNWDCLHEALLDDYDGFEEDIPTKEEIAEQVFDEADWCYISTVIANMTI